MILLKCSNRFTISTKNRISRFEAVKGFQKIREVKSEAEFSKAFNRANKTFMNL